MIGALKEKRKERTKMGKSNRLARYLRAVENDTVEEYHKSRRYHRRWQKEKRKRSKEKYVM